VTVVKDHLEDVAGMADIPWQNFTFTPQMQRFVRFAMSSYYHAGECKYRGASITFLFASRDSVFLSLDISITLL
jgi:hypothetical protein